MFVSKAHVEELSYSFYSPNNMTHGCENRSPIKLFMEHFDV